MGVYNSCRTLARSIDSLRQQTFRDWEAIVVDDGSTDGSFELLQQLALVDRRIRPIRLLKNAGLANALNIARKYATGKYLARQDADDYSYSRRIELQQEFLRGHPDVAVVGTYAHLVNDEGLPWGLWSPPVKPQVCDWVKGSSVIHASVLMRSEAFDAVCGYNERLRRTEDYDLWLRMQAYGFGIATLPEPLYAIRWTLDDYRRRSLRGRCEEVVVRWRGFRRMGINPIYWPYVFKPVVAAIVPARAMHALHRHRFSGNSPGGYQ